MTIASETEQLQLNLQNAYTAVQNKGGTLPQDECFDNLATAINSITELKGETKTVNPSTSQQVITPSNDKNGITQVTVNAVTSAIDQDIIPSNIKSGVEILGITGNYAGQGATIDSLNVTPSTSAQTITASGGVDGFNPVNVSAVTSAIDSNIQSRFIRNGIEILGITGIYGDAIPYLLSCSGTTTWYVNSSGELYGCGSNNYGQQGSGDTSDVTTFTKRADNVVKITPYNEDATWYVNLSGELYGTGANYGGQQGSGNTSNVTTFIKRADNVVQVACSGSTTWYINSSGELYGCGSGLNGKQGSGSSINVTTFTKRADNVVQIACSSNTTWYINSSGELYGCGRCDFGGQGSGDTSDVTTFTKRADNVIQVVCSQTTTWYVNSSNEVYGCGYNNKGQQGSGDISNVLTFTKRN